MRILRDIFFFTDIHGMYDLYRAIMSYCYEEDPEAMIIFGGDAIDRGKDGYKIMKELLDNPQVVYLMGNHEDLFVKAAKEIKEQLQFRSFDRKEVHDTIYWCRGYDYKYEAIQNSLYNGGLNTLIDWVLDGMPMDIIEKIEALPRTMSTELCDFCHSAGVFRTFAEASTAEYYNRKMDEYIADALIWGRSALMYGWKTGRTAICGHTPTIVLDQFVRLPTQDIGAHRPIKWCNGEDEQYKGAKIDMDTGACFTGISYVLNVLTMQAQGFKDIDFENKENHEHNVEKIDVIQF